MAWTAVETSIPPHGVCSDTFEELLHPLIVGGGSGGGRRRFLEEGVSRVKEWVCSEHPAERRPVLLFLFFELKKLLLQQLLLDYFARSFPV